MQPLRLVVLGDGYTHGTSTAAPNRDSWPAQLQAVTRGGDMRIRLVRNLAASSRTSEDVLVDQLPQVESLQPDLVTVQVGANDIFTGTAIETYRDNLGAIFDGLLEYVPAEHIFAITTPDHELTERGRNLGRAGSDAGQVGEFNEALHAVAVERDIEIIDIAPISELVIDDPSMVVGGGPDPSARQYAGWVEIIGQGSRRSLTASEP